MHQRFRKQPAGTVHILWILAVALWFAAGCGSLPDDSSGSIFEVMAVHGYYKDTGTFSNQVDVVPSNCSTDPTQPSEPEFYSDHYVTVDFLNRQLPNRNVGLGTVGSPSEEYTASVIYLTEYVIRYTPLTAVTAPYPLPSPLVVPVTHTVAVPPCSPALPGQTCPATTMTQVYFVPVATKAVLRDYFEDAGEQLAYNADYVFHGVNDFGIAVSASGNLDFYVANYNFCE